MKTCGRFPISHNLTAKYYDRTSVEFGFLKKGMGHFGQNFRWKGTSSTGQYISIRTLETLHFHIVLEYRQQIFRFVTVHVLDGQTDRRMETQNFDQKTALS